MTRFCTGQYRSPYSMARSRDATAEEVGQALGGVLVVDRVEVQRPAQALDLSLDQVGRRIRLVPVEVPEAELEVLGVWPSALSP
jgi:hypothetical protein